MEKKSRIKKSLLNAKVNSICYFIALIISFFSRKIFIDNLGTEFMGLYSTFQSLLSFLNIAELGISSAVAYVLYKPIFNDDKLKINEIVSVYGYLYRWIGIIILGAGFILSLFLPLIFSKTSFSFFVIYIGFYVFLASSLLGYFVNYRTLLLSADQRNYEVTGYYQLITFTKTIVQMFLALLFCNYILFFSIEILFSIIYSVILNVRINKVYPWLATDLKSGRQLFKKYPEIAKYVKQLFVHKISGIVQLEISPILIYAFVSLPMVTLYTNYTTISNKLWSFLGGVMDSTLAGVGNLIAEGNMKKVFETYKELLSLRYFAGGLMASCFFYLASNFVSLWLGHQYILSNITVLLVTVQLFMLVARGANDQFLNGFGLFYDVWAPVTEVVIYVSSAVIFGHYWGLNGVLMGPLVSMGFIVYLWKPYFLFTKGLKIRFYKYWILFFKYIIIIVGSSMLSNECVTIFGIQSTSWLTWILKSCVYFMLLLILQTIFFALTSPELYGLFKKIFFKNR